MKKIWGNPPLPDEDEHELEKSIKALAGAQESKASQPLPDVYWHNLLIRTNRRLDDATSAKALSISWAARVAIPGVVAILSFLIGIYIYIPEKNPAMHSLEEALLIAPDHQIDSLVASDFIRADGSAELLSESILLLPGELAQSYLLENTPSNDLLNRLSDEEVNQVLAVLGSSH